MEKQINNIQKTNEQESDLTPKQKSIALGVVGIITLLAFSGKAFLILSYGIYPVIIFGGLFALWKAYKFYQKNK